ncbi:unnamed protein product [Urochloa humidicola]
MDARSRFGRTSETHRGAADKKAAPEKRLQVPGYLHGYTWGEVFRDPLVLVLIALHLLTIWFICRSMEFSMENLGAYVLFFLMLMQYALLCIFALVEDPWGSYRRFRVRAATAATTSEARPPGWTSGPSAPGVLVDDGAVRRGMVSCPCCGAGLSLRLCSN